MTLAQAFIQKLGAFIAGGIAFSIPWLLIDQYATASGISVRTVASLGSCLVVALVLDSGIYRLGLMRQGKEGGTKKPKNALETDDDKAVFLCPSCGKTYAHPVRVMDPKTEKFLYSACPKCGKPLDNPQPAPPPLPSELPKQPSNAPPPAAEVGRSLGIPLKPEPKPAKALVEIRRPDGTLITIPE